MHPQYTENHCAAPHFAPGMGYFTTTSASPGFTLPAVALPPGQRTVISEVTAASGTTKTAESCDQ